MKNFVIVIVILLDLGAVIYAFTFGQWLKKKGEVLGAFGVYMFIIVNIAITTYSTYQTISK